MIIVMVVLMGVVLGSLASACISFPGIELRQNSTYSNNIFFEGGYRNESAVLEQLNMNKDLAGLSDEDIQILKDFIINGYSVKEQTDDEYNLFLEEAEKANAEAPSNCPVYGAVSHKGRWTGYIWTGNVVNDVGMCGPKERCAGALANIIWNDLKENVGNVKSYAVYYWIIGALVVIMVSVVLIVKSKGAE